MRKRFYFLVALIAMAAPVQAAHIRGKILRVGFPGSGSSLVNRGSDYFRPGAWTPVRVELTNDDSDLFEGSIEIGQPDRDGDLATAIVPVAVRGVRNYYVYVPAGATDWQNAPFQARVLGPNGSAVPLHNDQDKRVGVLIAPTESQPVRNNAQVILDISHPPVNRLDILVNNPLLVRELVVTRIGPNELPDQVTGLEWVDMIVWDNPDPASIDLPQREALIEFVRRGGTLILGVGKNWQSVTHSILGELLPAPLTGAQGTRQMPALSNILTGGLTGVEFNPPLIHCPVKRQSLVPGSTVIIPPPENLMPDEELAIVSRPFGRGKTILVTAEINELLNHAAEGQRPIFLRELLGLRRQTKDRQDQIYWRDIFEYLEETTGFKVTSNLYFIFACLFVVAYIAVATGGSWTWLKRRQRLYQTWPAFAVIAVLASGTSLAAVQIIRGIGIQVQQFSLVNAQAGSPNATATCYFGLKTASHQQLDLTVPANATKPNDTVPIAGSLAPLPTGGQWEEGTFSAGQPYEVIAALGQLRAVPMRATLKQFRGFWNGQLSGQLNAFLKYRNTGSYLLRNDSWFENQLGVNLEKCYLFVSLYNPGSGSESTRYFRTKNIGVYSLGRLLAGQKITGQEVAEKSQTAAENQTGDWRPSDLLTVFQSHWLEEMHVQINENAYNMNRNQKQEITSNEAKNELTSALLLGTTWAEVDATVFGENGIPLQLTRASELDRSAHLTKDSALLVGFTQGDRGPARICCRNTGALIGGWKAINPTESRVMYRFAIPVNPPD